MTNLWLCMSSLVQALMDTPDEILPGLFLGSLVRDVFQFKVICLES